MRARSSSAMVGPLLRPLTFSAIGASSSARHVSAPDDARRRPSGFQPCGTTGVAGPSGAGLLQCELGLLHFRRRRHFRRCKGWWIGYVSRRRRRTANRDHAHGIPQPRTRRRGRHGWCGIGGTTCPPGPSNVGDSRGFSMAGRHRANTRFSSALTAAADAPYLKLTRVSACVGKAGLPS